MDLHLDIPSMNNIYDSRYFDKVKADEQNRSNKLYEYSKKPYETGIVSKTAGSAMFNRKFYSEINDNNNNNNNNRGGGGGGGGGGSGSGINDDNYTFSLTGERVPLSSFSHNNMTPFLKKNVTQNTNVENMSMLDNLTGNNSLKKGKQEIQCMFKPQMNSGGNICGMKNNDDFFKSRIELSEVANNFFPIEKIRVGPGLNQGFGSESSGGFHQADTLEYAKPRSLDELRSKINQKETYFEIPVKGHLKGPDRRGEIAPMAKQRPDTVFEQTEDMWIKTTGANTKDTLRPAQNIRPTVRQESHIEYKGNIAKNDLNQGIKDDYGKSKIILYNNERETTENKTVITNVTSIIKAIVSPIMDALKYTNKEYTVEATRGVGNPSIQIPSKATLYDPVNHIMKTTVKETTIHDNEAGNLTGNKETYSALTDTAKTTVKETTLHDNEPGNLTGNKETYSAATDLAKTTIKETLIHDTVLTNVKSNEAAYFKNSDDAKKTLRQTLPTQDTVRNIGGVVYKVTLYDPDIVAKTTTKETTIMGKSEYGFIGGMLEGIFGGYINKNVEMKNTQKQFTSDVSEYGIAGSTNEYRQPDRTADENAEIDGTREAILIAAGHTPNPGNVNIGIDSADIDMYSKKPIENSFAAREKGNVGIIYQSTPSLDNCGITKMPNKSNAYSNRLDADLLEAVNNNDLMRTQKINPIVNGCRI
jgi:hypothetical protein